MQTEWVEFMFNNSIISNSQTKQIVLIKFIFLITSIPLFSQSFESLEFNAIYIEPESPNDIYSINSNRIKPYVYTLTPDLLSLNVNERKQKFIDLILPSILIEKAKIEHMYNYVYANFDHITLNNQTKVIYDYCKCTDRNELLVCLANQPNSIIIAQAALESGWGTSRFFLEGFNLFGIHTYNLNDSKMKAKGSGDLAIYVKKYDSLLNSISNYLRTLATGYAYDEFRKKRLELVDWKEMIRYLDQYSERRELYIDDLESIIDYNNLCKYDTLELDVQ